DISFFFSSRRRHTRFSRDWSSDVCSSDLPSRRRLAVPASPPAPRRGVRGVLGSARRLCRTAPTQPPPTAPTAPPQPGRSPSEQPFLLDVLVVGQHHLLHPLAHPHLLHQLAKHRCMLV